MKIGIFADAQECASVASEIIIDLFADDPTSVLGVATGSTPEPTYQMLRQAHQAGRFSLAKGQAFALDEYVGIPSDHPERYRNMLLRNLVENDATGLLDENLHTPDSEHPDPQVAAAEYEAKIAAIGGVSLQILGIGTDGHIGFNEPGTSLTEVTHVDYLMEQTRIDNARFFDHQIDQVPTQCITQGLGTIMSAKRILLLATGKQKAEAVKEICEGSVSAFWPGSILQMHRQATVLLDEDAASHLQLADYYRQRWALQQG